MRHAPMGWHLQCIVLLGATQVLAVPCNVGDEVKAFYQGRVIVDAEGKPQACERKDESCWYDATIAGRDRSDEFTLTWAEGDQGKHSRVHASDIRQADVGVKFGEFCDATHQTHLDTLPKKAEAIQAARYLMNAAVLVNFTEPQIRMRLPGAWKWRATRLDSRCEGNALTEGSTEGLDISGLSNDALSDFVRLFVLHMALPDVRVVDILDGPHVFSALKESGILGADSRTRLVRSYVQLFEVDGVLLTTDWQCTSTPTHDVDPVMPIGLDSVTLARLVPRDPVSTLLDVCTGSGIQGLVAAKYYANEVTLLDVNPRATRFAEFNVALNGMEGKVRVLPPGSFNTAELTAKQGMSKRFDRILGNPPFNLFPDHYFKNNMAHRELFSDGGQLGEEVTAQIVGNSTTLLAPGGSLFLGSQLIVNIDTLGHRLARWWSDAGGGAVDVLVPHSEFQHPIAYGLSTLSGSDEDFDWLDAQGVTNFVRGLIVIHRRSGASTVAPSYGSAIIAQVQEQSPEVDGKVPVTLIDLEGTCGMPGGSQPCITLSERLKVPFPNSTSFPPRMGKVPSMAIQPDGKVLVKMLPPELSMEEAKKSLANSRLQDGFRPAA